MLGWPRKAPHHSIYIVLKTQRLLLRPAQANDYAEWVDVRARNRKYLEPFEPVWPQNCLGRDFFLRRAERVAQDWKQDRMYGFLIFQLDTDVLIGGININNVVRGAGQYASLGYWLSQESQGQGYMTEATRTVLAYAFEDLGLARMNAATLPHNHKSRAMLERVGFTEEGFAKAYIQIDGRRQDHVLYGLNAADFSGAA